eukprot:3518257-Prymnesium_polylepis.1
MGTREETDNSKNRKINRKIWDHSIVTMRSWMDDLEEVLPKINANHKNLMAMCMVAATKAGGKTTGFSVAHWAVQLQMARSRRWGTAPRILCPRACTSQLRTRPCQQT